MHLLPTQSGSLDDDAPALDLGHSPAPLLVLSFTDSDLAVMATAWELDADALPGLRLVNLAKLKHPYSVDLFVEQLASRASFIFAKVLGGADYWRYGIEELAVACRRHGIALALLPGDGRDDPRLAAASTVTADTLDTLQAYGDAGGVGNAGEALRFMAQAIGHPVVPRPPTPVPAAGVHRPASRPGPADAPHALIVFYRSALLAADTAPIAALGAALTARGARVTAFFVTSLKDDASVVALTGWLDTHPIDVILNTTAFSARGDRGSVLDRADVPVIQAVLSGATAADWSASSRGLRAADLAMNVVLPELDGRLGGGVVSFKSPSGRRGDLEFTRVVHKPDPAGVARTVDLALAWARLRRVPRPERRLACVLSDYPGKDGRAGYAVGLDTPASVAAIAQHLHAAGFAVEPPTGDLMRRLTEATPEPILSLAAYRRLFAALPASFTATVAAAWGDPEADPSLHVDHFAIRMVRAGTMPVVVQPDRGSAATRRSDYHDAALPPRHGYVAFYLWLRHVERCHATIHLGTHGTLEWLPGKAVALGPDCAPLALVGDMPVIYPFIVNNPGEAAQAKRRVGALTLGHLTPPLIEAGAHGDLADLERLFDEYAEALTLDGRRARLLSDAILAHAVDRDLLPSGLPATASADERLAALDAWLCDLKEMRIGDGLHVFGSSPDLSRRTATLEDVAPEQRAEAQRDLDRCGPAELEALVAALDGRFVPPGPAGAPARNRLDVIPTGRNLFAIDPRAVPTRTAWDLGSRMAEDLVTRYAQDHGEWPRRIVLDLWGSATMRTGGDDLAQAFALLGARPRWDHASTRVSGFEIVPLARLGRARVDVTLRVSGLFRDTCPDQIALFDAAVRAVAALDEDEADNPLVPLHRTSDSLTRVFGGAPGTYGIGLARTLAEASTTDRATLGGAYLAASSHGVAAGGGFAADPGFRDRVAKADAFSHTGDLPGQDLLDSDTIAEHEGGFAAAAALLGRKPALYHADTTRPSTPRLRELGEEIDRVMRARATNPRWIAGQMRHGYRGAAAIAETLDALFAFAATTDAVPSRHFDLYFDATCGDEAVRRFLELENPAAARAMAAKFQAALACGYWHSRRNSVAATLASLGDIT